MNFLHYAPANGWFGDPMPLYAEGRYHVYYTKLLRDSRLCWGHVSSVNLTEWEEHPDLILPDEEDIGICTGSVLFAQGKYHAFYAAKDSNKVPHILKAVSDDGIVFRKTRRSLLSEERTGYRQNGTWRDPCVFWNPAEKCYWMVFCAKGVAGRPDPFPGVVGLAKSADLELWDLFPPLWETGMARSPECPDIFPVKNRWAMLYYWHDSRIRTADSLIGPWKRSEILSPDHFDFMAAKQLSDGKRHLMFGWIPRKHCDCGERIWGGHAACPRELTIDHSGRPASRFFQELDRLFPYSVPLFTGEQFVSSRGTWSWTGDGFSAWDGFAVTSVCPQDYRLRCQLNLEGSVAVGMVLLRTHGPEQFPSAEADNGYALLFDRPSQLLRLRELYQWDQRPDLAVVPWRTYDGPTQVDLLLNGDILEVNLNDSESLVCRLMKAPTGGLGFCVQDGGMTVQNGVVWTKSENW